MTRRLPLPWLFVGSWLLLLAGAAMAAGSADISNVPPSTLTSSNVRANLMFVLDDSGSMAWDYLPDSVGGDAAHLCFSWSGHNYVFFDPSITYTAPVDASGNSLGDANFSGVYADGFTKSGGTIDLSNVQNLSTSSVAGPVTTTNTTGTATCAKDQAPCNGSNLTTTTTSTTNGVVTTTKVTQTRTSSPINNGSATCKNGAANSCIVNVSIKTDVNDTFKPYWSTLNSGATDDCTTDSNYTPVYKYSVLTSTQKQNYANWYQYYRTRMLMMRSASGRVFAGIDASRFRVGFATIAAAFTTDTGNFLHTDDFDKGTGGTSQKALFYTKLYGQAPSGSTPLRPALDKTGHYFANKITGQTDPMQYSCQRNYLLLSTDGYWNTGGEPSNYIPKQLDGTAIGNQDGTAARPLLDTTGALNSLADMAKYYYDTDLRTPALNNCSGSVANQNVCTNKDPKPGDNSPLWQNVTTYTLGLGVPGVLNYQSDYDTAASGDFHDIVTGAKNWPDPLSSSNGGFANTGNTVTSRIDDLWHAAVNAGGRYYSARNPNELIAGLTDALQKIDAVDGASAAASTSTLRPVPGDDWVFIPSYETQTWVGDVGAYHFTIDPVTGQIGVSNTASWNAAKTLAAQSSRTIYFFDTTSSGNLQSFNYSNLPAAKRAYFDNLCASGSYKLSQCGLLTSNALSKVTGDNVVNYLRGQRTYEMSQSLADNQVFRTRQDAKNNWTPLGDVINASPAYARLPPFKYTDAGYSEFKEAQKDRIGVLYVAANDGMLHAFRATDGLELWAYIPTQVMSNMYRLADRSYVNGHQYFVDGSPVIADVHDSSGWHTILVGGMGGGGRGYYALDVTDPTAPKGLWEFTDTDMGLTFGEPVVTKNKAGTWVVAVTSGYNNTMGDGNGHLYLINAMTGAQVQTRLDTMIGSSKAGTSSAPSNLGKINAWVDSDKDNTAKRVYGGDMLGNVWRFDFDDNVLPSGREAVLLGVAQDPSGKVQPITVQPILSEQSSGTSKFPVVTVGTGRYLGTSDLADTTIQSVYSFKDTLAASGIGVIRNAAGMVKQTLNSSHTLTSTLTVDWATNEGWFLDFDQTDSQSKGERINVDMDLQLNVLTIATTVPTPTPCSPGGTSWLYFFSMGGSILSSTESATPIVGISTLVEGSNTNNPQTITLATKSDRSIARYQRPKDPSGGGGVGAVRRTSWRELVN